MSCAFGVKVAVAIGRRPFVALHRGLLAALPGLEEEEGQTDV